jgi:sterol desaturase/sphingolipid hydroxylase (fatty acid hydroxylase superfamily)
MDWLLFVAGVYARWIPALIVVVFTLHFAIHVRSFNLRNALALPFLGELTVSILSLSIWAVGSGVVLYSKELLDPDKKPVPYLYYPLWFLFMLLLVDTLFYWTHRLLHHPRVFGWAHHTHHAYTSPTAASAYSFHFLESAALVSATVVLPYLVLPLNFYCGVAFNLFAMFWAAFLHSGYDSSGWQNHPILRHVYGPSLHRDHHAQGHGNYGLYFTFWDFFWGTGRKASRS